MSTLVFLLISQLWAVNAVRSRPASYLVAALWLLAALLFTNPRSWL